MKTVLPKDKSAVLPQDFINKTENIRNHRKQSNADRTGDFIEPQVRTEQSLPYLYKVYHILGINLSQRWQLRYITYICYSVVINSCVTFFLPIAFFASYFHMTTEEMEIGNFLSSFQVSINVAGCSAKVLVMAFMLPKLRSAGPVMARMDSRCQYEDEINELRKMVRRGKRLVIGFAMAYLSYSTSTLISALINGSPPYGTYNPFFDWRKSREQFTAVCIMEYCMMCVACVQQVADDSYAVIYVSIVRTHIRILLLRVSKLGRVDPHKTPDDFLEELKQCILDHKNVLELYNIIAPIISITIFIQFMITATLMSATLINILLFSTSFASNVASCFYMLAVVVQIFPLCYNTQCLMDECSRLPVAIFHSNWIGQDARYRKMLVFFMQRSQRIIELSAGKLFPITLNSFLSIAKFSFSLYTLIKGMGLKEKFNQKE